MQSLKRSTLHLKLLTLMLPMAATLQGCGGAGESAQQPTPLSHGVMMGAPLAAAATVAAPGNYYVALDGADSNAGTIDRPWRTIARAVRAAGPGVNVYVRAGVYRERVRIGASGVSGAYFTVQSYPYETAVLDGTGLTPPTDGSTSGMLSVTDASFVKVSGFEIRNYSTTSASAVPAGIVVSGAGSNIEIRNNRVHHIRTLVGSAMGNAFGIAVYGSRAPASINGLIIDGNEVSDLLTGSSESVAVNGNVERWQITNNQIHDNNNIGIDAIGYEGTAPDAAYDRARDGLISGNIVYNISSYGNPAYGAEYAADGIYVDGGTRIIIEGNRVHHSDIGIEVASEHKSKFSDYVTVRNNLIYLNAAVGLSIGGYSKRTGGTDHCNFINNTLYQNDTTLSGTGEVQIQYNASNNQFKNNLVHANGQALFTSHYNAASPTPLAMDGNLYFSPRGPGKGNWQWLRVVYSSLAAFQAASGNDLHSSVSDPGLIGPGQGDMRIAPSSWAVGHGLGLAVELTGSVDFTGAARVQGLGIDIGAVEQ